MPLSEHQWEITSPSGRRLVFGTLDTGLLTLSRPDLGQRGIRHQDAPLPGEDGTAFGLDFHDGTSITFELGALHPDHRTHVDALASLDGMWHDRSWRNVERRVGTLATCVAGRQRVCYGRPRRYAETDGDLTHEGYTKVVCDFATVDGLYYDATEQVASIGIVPPASVGFTTPIITTGNIAFQTLTLDPSELPGAALVEGEDTWPVITIHGPVSGPLVRLGEIEVELDTALAAGQFVTVDPRPWSRAVTRNDGANLAGRLTWRTPPLGQVLLTPGAHQITYIGTDATGSSYVEVRWRNAHSRP